MRDYLSRMGFRLFVSYFMVILIGMASIWIASRFTAQRAYDRHLYFMDQRMDAGNGAGPGQGPGQGGMMKEYYENFQTSFNESLIIAVLVASGVALIASGLFSRRIVEPVRVMMKASQRVAEGHYDERVSSSGTDELSELARSFNQMAGQLQQVETKRRQLIGDVAHELRTPLTAIKGSAEGLLDGLIPASVETFTLIHEETERLSRLVDDLQELSRVESRATQLDISAVEAGSLIRTVEKRMKIQFDRKRIRLTCDLPKDPLMIQADGDRVVQVLTNLLNNALQHTSKKGHVELSVDREHNRARFAVRDDGSGISKEHLGRIFDRFYRADPSRSRSKGGSGIGLTIAKHLVEAQGGEIWVESQGQNLGSVFYFTLPIAD